MSKQRMLPIEERLSRVEAQVIVGADQVAGLRRLIDYLESQHSDYDRLISDLDDDVRDLRRVVSNHVKALKRRVRELEGLALTL
jgi:hypothetical protein